MVDFRATFADLSGTLRTTSANILLAEARKERANENLRFRLANRMMTNNWRIKEALGLDPVWYSDTDETLEAVDRYDALAEEKLAGAQTDIERIALEACRMALFDARQRIKAAEDI